MQTRLAEQQAPAEQPRSAVPKAEHGDSARTPEWTAIRTGVRAAIADPRPVSAGGLLLQLQRALGNRYVQQAVARAGRVAAAAPAVQPKLVVGPAGDRHEREADRVAGAAGRWAAQRTEDLDGQPAQLPPVIERMAAAEGGPVDDRLRQAIGQARGGGRPLPAQLRGSMERALGADFDRVRLHTDPQADRFNRALQARAFTIGRDIFFRRGDYSPDSARGRRLLAHELTHVVQQGAGLAGAAPAVQRELIQRVLTDEARAVLEEAERRQPGFRKMADIDHPAADAILLLQGSTKIQAGHLREIMHLPAGAPADLESYVQAWLLRYFASEAVTNLMGGGQKTDAEKDKIITACLARTVAYKQTLITTGYGQAEITPELKSTMLRHFSEGGIVPVALEKHIAQHFPTADPRKVEVCATYIPGRQFDVLGRAHSFILYTDVSGKITYVSAHDDGTGRLGADYGIWSPSKFDDMNFERVVVATGHAASASFHPMIEAVQHINDAKIKYKMTEQNCNSATHYILKAANLEHAQAPSFMTGQFGWSKRLEKKIGRPLPYYPALPPVMQTTATTTTAPPVPAAVASTTAMPAFPQQMPVLPATPGNVASTSVTTRAFAGATVSTPRRGQPPARQQRIGATRRARPRLQPEPTRTSESEESEELTEPTTPREPGATAREFDEDTYQLPVAVTLGTGQIPPGTMITVEAVGLTNNQVKIRISDGRLVIVRRDELERALGRRLAE